MEILKKFLNLIFEYFESRRQIKIEREERERVLIEQKQKTAEDLKNRKKTPIKTSTDENFFND